MLNIKKVVLCAFALITVMVLNVFVGYSLKTASATTALSVVMDESYIKSAVVSELPIRLESKVYNKAGNYIYNKEIKYTITNGGERAEIRDGNKLYVISTGEFTVKAELAEDSAVFDTCECVANVLTFSNVKILSRIENITVDTQPIMLTGTLDVDGIDIPVDVHYELCFVVEEGPAEIFTGNYIKFTGEGVVTLKAYSRYNSDINVVIKITVNDPDKDKVASGSAEHKQGELEKSGCGGNIGYSAIVSVLALIGLASLVFVKRKNKA